MILYTEFVSFNFYFIVYNKMYSIYSFCNVCLLHNAHMFVLAKICNLVNLICNEIYPSDLEIVMTNDDNKFTTFLDLEISINNTLFDTKPYDIRRDFKF